VFKFEQKKHACAGMLLTFLKEEIIFLSAFLLVAASLLVEAS
jgi:hypothetical protein